MSSKSSEYHLRMANGEKLEALLDEFAAEVIAAHEVTNSDWRAYAKQASLYRTQFEVANQDWVDRQNAAADARLAEDAHRFLEDTA